MYHFDTWYLHSSSLVQCMSQSVLSITNQPDNTTCNLQHLVIEYNMTYTKFNFLRFVSQVLMLLLPVIAQCYI